MDSRDNERGAFSSFSLLVLQTADQALGDKCPFHGQSTNPMLSRQATREHGVIH